MKKNIFVNDGEIKRDGNILKINGVKIPLSIVNNIFVFDRVKMSISARNLLFKNKRAVFFMNYKYELLGMLLPNFFESNYSRRINQYQKMNSLECAKKIILKKIEAIEKIANASLEGYKIKLKNAENLNIILGIEGSVSSFMFNEFRKRLKKEGINEFKSRSYRPIKDRVNGILSFLYTLYYSYVINEIIAEGFDPYVGFLHRKHGKHAVFASDVMEEARVCLTFLAVDILKKVYPDGFDGMYLKKEARKEVLREFDKFILEYENSILKEFKDSLC